MKLTLFTAASISALVLSAPAANAALDHATQAKIDALAKRVQELEAQQKNMAPLTEEDRVTAGPNKTLKISGQINRSALWIDNGKKSNVTHVDNDNSSSRLRIEAEGNFSTDMTVGAAFEFNIRTNSSSNINVQDSDSTPGNNFKVRFSEVYFNSNRFGRLTLGKGATASYYILSDTDLSGTGATADGVAAASETAGGVAFFNSALNTQATPLTIGTVFEPGDGLGRQDRVLYETPTFYGFKLSTSHAHVRTGNMWDVALRYAGEMSGTKINFQTAYAQNKSHGANGSEPGQQLDILNTTIVTNDVNGNFKLYSVGAGVLLPFGVSANFTYAHKDYDYEDAKNGNSYFGKLGYMHDFIEAGKTCFAFDYGVYENMGHISSSKIKGKSYGLVVVQKLDRVATDVYADVRRYQLDNISFLNNARFKDATAVMLGARVKL